MERRSGALPLRQLAALALTAAVAACSDPDAGRPPDRGSAGATPPPVLPMKIHEMPLVEVTVGPEARGLIGRLHRADVAPATSYVGRYRGGGWEAVLYVSRFSAAGQADSLVLEMDRAIRAESGESPFAHHARFPVADMMVHTVHDRRRAHFFFARGSEVLWLGIDRRMARVGLSELLEVEREQLPAQVRVGGVDVLPPSDLRYRRGNRR